MADLRDLEEFDDDFKPAEVNQKPGVGDLADGNYEIEIENAELVNTPQTGELILRWSLKVFDGPRNYIGFRFETASFFRTQSNVDFLGKDLGTLGFPTDKWNRQHGTSFSKELAKAVPQLRGIRYLAKKVATKDKQDAAKVYHNLYINKRVGVPPVSSAPGAMTSAYVPPASGEPEPW
jgi:hypothetical protein